MNLSQLNLYCIGFPRVLMPNRLLHHKRAPRSLLRVYVHNVARRSRVVCNAICVCGKSRSLNISPSTPTDPPTPSAMPSTTQDLLTRMRAHKGNVPTLPKTKYCTLCPATFTRTMHLNRHLRSRTWGSILIPRGLTIELQTQTTECIDAT